jgi:signal peptidase I
VQGGGTRPRHRRGRGAIASPALGWAGLIAATGAQVYLVLLLALAVIAVLPSVLGWHATVIQTGSMRPHIDPGDAVVLAPWSPGDPVPMGGVVQYLSPAAAEADGTERLRVHRIVAEDPEGTYVTAGDANAEVDSTPLREEQITGQARLLVPGIGLPGLWLGTGNLPALAAWSALTVVAVVATVLGMGPTRGGVKTGSALGLVAGLLALVLAGATAFSAAAFTATTANAANTFGAAPDWTPPTVSVTSPGATITSTTVTATAADARSGIDRVTLQYAPVAGTTWTALCTRTAAPYSCPWNTQAVPDGAYRLRAVATDRVGLSTVSDPVETRVANTVGVTLADPGEIQRGTVALNAAVSGPVGTHTVRVQYSPEGANQWTTLCGNLTGPYSCSWNTTGVANNYYDLRAVLVSGSSTVYSETIPGVSVDNQAPTVTFTDPGSLLSGTRTLAATASDDDSGIARVELQYSRTGTWTTLCTVETAPYSCRFDTTTVSNGSYGFRAIATDAAGNFTTSTVLSNRTVDNTVASVSVEDPGTYLTGVVGLTAAAHSPQGVRNVGIQTAPAGTTAWTTRCTVAAAPYACTWDTRAVADGLYDIRAVMTDNLGVERASTTVTGRRVDNSPMRGVDVQATAGSGTAGRLGAGDTLSLTYSQQVNPATVTPGWTGAAMQVTVRLRDGNLLGTGNAGDTVDVQRTGGPVNLGTVNLGQNFIKNRKTTTIDATMTASTQTVQGVPRTVVTLTLGNVVSGASSLRTVSATGTMVWTPLAAVTNTSGTATSTAPVRETGTLDRDF